MSTSEYCIQDAAIRLTTSEGLPIFLGNVTNCVNSVREEEVEKISFQIRETQSYPIHTAPDLARFSETRSCLR